MLRANLKKIKSELNASPPYQAWSFWIVVVSGFVLFLIMAAQGMLASSNTTTVLRTSRQIYYLERADTPELQSQGLGGRKALAKDRGMLFPFSSQEDRCFWMQGMQFPIDIIWADNTKRITRIVADLEPSSYPKTYCAPARYVIELNKGEAAKSNLKEGSQLTF